ncbi:hypothetical protein ACIOHO_35195 [Streptomyces sp. NPDC087849]|uniref:hypothetical protein n=1 Tax=Streptomyces sp. NPDC087849 TaxID=3365808 RepID=UPI0038061042
MEFSEIFARLPSRRDRVLVAFYISTGTHAGELLTAWQGGVDPGRELIAVVRKGAGEVQELLASTDAFVWLRLYQLEMEDSGPRGRRMLLWWTLRDLSQPLTYHAAHRMFERANAKAGTTATLHALGHTAAHRMAEDPNLSLADVQFVIENRKLATVQLYLTPRKEAVVRRLLAHHTEQTRQAAARTIPLPASGYRPESLDILFGAGTTIICRVRDASGAIPLVRAYDWHENEWLEPTPLPFQRSVRTEKRRPRPADASRRDPRQSSRPHRGGRTRRMAWRCRGTADQSRRR